MAQTIKDDRMLIPMISANLGYNHSTGDFADRFGESGQVGAGFMLKFKNNILLGVEGNYLFNDDIRSDDYYKYLSNEDGFITNIYGEVGVTAERLSGFTVFGKVGYVIPVLNPNPNSGIFVSAGAGLMQHKIFISDRYKNIPQLSEEYIKGYDRLSNGLMLNQFVGYMFFAEKAIWNFYAGFEFSQGFTQNRRDWDFIEEKKIEATRLDLLYSFKVGWVISLHRRMATEYYYY
ncbi:MAG: hypothetical protein C0599_18155 [Salinivirgaceae bacterium]|nr:MAG: hypothetical protein C0599_18155 [Salinivirgaceae bacterium]